MARIGVAAVSTRASHGANGECTQSIGTGAPRRPDVMARGMQGDSWHDLATATSRTNLTRIAKASGRGCRIASSIDTPIRWFLRVSALAPNPANVQKGRE